MLHSLFPVDLGTWNWMLLDVALIVSCRFGNKELDVALIVSCRFGNKELDVAPIVSPIVDLGTRS